MSSAVSGAIKTDLHTHTADDPHDAIPHSATDLIDRATSLDFGALAITLHDRQLDRRDLVEYAASRGIVLIGGVERTIAGKHVLLLNFGAEAEPLETFDALRSLKQRTPNGLVIAPHPFYPAPSCLGAALRRHPDLFDAVEFNAFFTSTINVFNAAAVRWASAHHKPIVANSDTHRLWQLGRTYSLVDAAPTADAICRAIRTGRIQIRTAPISIVRAVTYFADLVVGQVMAPRRSPIEQGLVP